MTGLKYFDNISKVFHFQACSFELDSPDGNWGDFGCNIDGRRILASPIFALLCHTPNSNPFKFLEKSLQGKISTFTKLLSRLCAANYINIAVKCAK